eukprot:673370-Hanusia_phi.AAC.2
MQKELARTEKKPKIATSITLNTLIDRLFGTKARNNKDGPARKTQVNICCTAQDMASCQHIVTWSTRNAASAPPTEQRSPPPTSKAKFMTSMGGSKQKMSLMILSAPPSGLAPCSTSSSQLQSTRSAATCPFPSFLAKFSMAL